MENSISDHENPGGFFSIPPSQTFSVLPFAKEKHGNEMVTISGPTHLSLRRREGAEPSPNQVLVIEDPWKPAVGPEVWGPYLSPPNSETPSHPAPELPRPRSLPAQPLLRFNIGRLTAAAEK